MKSNKAFTLVELMIVISIVGMLATIATPKFSDMVRKAREAVTKSNLGVLRSVSAIYYADHNGVWAYQNAGIADFQYFFQDLDDGAALAPQYVNAIPALQTGQLLQIEGKKEVAATIEGAGTTFGYYNDRGTHGTVAAWVYNVDLGTWYVNEDALDTKGDALHSW